jgi:hypothetical protein
MFKQQARYLVKHRQPELKSLFPTGFPMLFEGRKCADQAKTNSDLWVIEGIPETEIRCSEGEQAGRMEQR